ncbi:hypothetical protein [Catellatospora tritici]|uniref:hypothetical protein n=1 Tax=Catellatospora tritici TaxID=2851566 RepID=UPI001C2D1B70|nr:hypothetical protein [Catellatospora tritici]MBV1855995.1 hypothetical protein [Catellatospora tritici]
MDRIVIKPRIQITCLVIVFGVFGVLGIGYFTNLHVVAERNWFGLALGCVCTVGGLLGIWRSLWLGVVIDAKGVCVRNLDSRDDITPWQDVLSIECAQMDARAGLPIYGPVLLVGDPATALPIRPLGTYSRQDAERRTAQLRSLKDGAAPN